MTAAQRIPRLMAGVAVAGAAAGAALRGWPWAAAFLLGAAASAVIYWALDRAVAAIDPDRPPDKSMRGRVVVAGMRYLVLAAGAYAILKFSTLPVTGALAGLFVPAAAAVVEILVELVYGSS